MLKLNTKFNSVINIFKSNHIKWKILRYFATDKKVQVITSAREKAWKEAQQKYDNHPLIMYSSYLEALEMNNRKCASMERKTPIVLTKRIIDWLERQPLNRTEHTEEKNSDIEYKGIHNFQFPINWMEDYEFYKGDEDKDYVHEPNGTSDPSIPPSQVPCGGCGAHLHCIRASLPGYIPKEIFEGRNDTELRSIICQRCHFLKNYNIAVNVEICPEDYIKAISRIKDDFALAVLVVDLLDFPCSLWKGTPELLGTKRPIFVVGNKVDLLPRDSEGYLDHIKECLKRQLIRCGFSELNIKYIGLISAETGYGIEELITQLHRSWRYQGNVHLLGSTNVGKSTLFNILLNSDYCRPEATDVVRRATASSWPGTTLQMLKFPILRPSDIRVHQRFTRIFSERSQRIAEEKLRREQAKKTGSVHFAKLIGKVGHTFTKQEEVNDTFAMSKGTQPIVTLNERRLDYQKAKWCFDTPGVINPAQITNLLTTEELQLIEPTQMITPRAVRLKTEMSLFLGGLGRLDFLSYSNNNVDWVKVFIFASQQLPIVITSTKHADEMYEKYLGTEVLKVPFGTAKRMELWPGLHSKAENILVTGNNDYELNCDIVLSSAGWLGLHVPDNSECIFRAWTPYAKGTFTRVPPLIPHADALVGKIIRHSLAYNIAKPFVFRK